jgi:hypothetical protein
MSYLKEIMKNYSCFLLVNEWSLDRVVFHYDNIYLDLSATYHLLTVPACHISFGYSVFRSKHFNEINIGFARVIYYHLNFRDL